MRLPALLLLVGCHPPDPGRWTPVAAEPWDVPEPAPIPIPAALAGVEGLDDPSVWAFDGEPAGRGTTGSFGVGNGLAFGIVGLDDPVTTLTGATGPSYRLTGGAFGDSSIALVRPAMHQSAQRPRGAAIARTWLDHGDLALSTTDAAPPGMPVIVRHVTVWNRGAATSAVVNVSLARAADEVPPTDVGGLRQDRGERALLITCEGAVVVEDALEVRVDVPAGGEASFTCAWRFGEDAFDLPIDGPAAIAEAMAADRAWRAEAATVASGHPAVDDLVDGLLLTMRAQTHPSGVVSPMSRYGRGWLRDAEGPVALYLAAGRPDEAQRILDATYGAMVAQRAITNSFDPDRADPTDPDDPDAFWAAAQFMPGRQPSEAPSYAPILAGRLWRVTGEAPSDARRAFLRACLDRQIADERGILPFSGDETYRWPMSLVLGALPEELGGSTAANWLFAAGARELHAMGEPGYDDRADAALAALDAAWTGTHWSPVVGEPLPPYEDVAVQPWWLGLTTASDAHLEATIDHLWADGLLRSTATTGAPAMITGMSPGYGLYALDEAGSPLAADAFAALPRIASASGHFEEIHDAALSPLDLQHVADGTGEDVTARYRPWEGGVVGAAVLHHLVGAHPDAASRTIALHVGPSAAIAGLAFRDGRYDVEVEAYEEGHVVRIARAGGEGDWTFRIDGDERAWVDGDRVRGPIDVVVGPDEAAEVVIAR